MGWKIRLQMTYSLTLSCASRSGRGDQCPDNLVDTVALALLHEPLDQIPAEMFKGVNSAGTVFAKNHAKELHQYPLAALDTLDNTLDGLSELSCLSSGHHQVLVRFGSVEVKKDVLEELGEGFI
jgi:hypothetical protein